MQTSPPRYSERERSTENERKHSREKVRKLRFYEQWMQMFRFASAVRRSQSATTIPPHLAMGSSTIR